jgi:hypothetical protein
MSLEGTGTEPLRTAEWTCVARAISSLESSDSYRSHDHIASLRLPDYLRFFIQIPLVRLFYASVIVPKGIQEYVIARTKYTDAISKEALAERFDHILYASAVRFENLYRGESEIAQSSTLLKIWQNLFCGNHGCPVSCGGK